MKNSIATWHSLVIVEGAQVFCNKNFCSQGACGFVEERIQYLQKLMD